MQEIEDALALLRRKPDAAAMFLRRPTVTQIVNAVLARGIAIHGER